MNLTIQDPSVDSLFPHTDIFVLIDKHGVIRARRDKAGNPLLYHSKDSVAMNNLAEDLVLLSLEKESNEKSFLSGKLPLLAVVFLVAVMAVGFFLFIFEKKILMLAPVWKRNDKKAGILIITFSAIVFLAVVLLSRVKIEADLGFDVHLFALFNAIVNSCVAILLVAGLAAVKNRKYELHKKLMLTAMVLSVLFLVSYILHHLFAGDTRFGDIDHNGIVTDGEKANAGSSRIIYYIILGTHIPLAGIILPFILYTAYRALTGDWLKHKKLARITWPVWLYVAITGVLVYWMISPYY